MTNYKILENINSPSDLKNLPDEQILELNSEIRSFLIENVTKTGGHLASNLGVVEISTAIHRVFDAPRDHIIWDVGHQSYVHKILTGRRDRFDTLRKGGGISGFTKRSESEYDCFGTGHSSTSLSAGIGFAKADKISGNDNYTVVVVGDGAFTGGMIHEAINNCDKNLRLVIILNENEMSISKNIGRFAKSIAKIRTSKSYFQTKKVTVDIIKHIPLVGNRLFNVIKNFKKKIKNDLYGSNYFEDIGLFYIGPIDGNDYFKVEQILREAKELNESVIIHIKTKKGKGYPQAEKSPDKYHCVSPRGADENGNGEKEKFSSVFGKILSEKAKKDPKICAITAAMSSGTGLDLFRREHPKRFFDVGIAEEHALTFSAGLAANGMKPFFAVYSSFLQRGYDNIIHDIALQKLPVVICVDRAGLNAYDGATHHGIFDVAFLSHIPNIKIYTPASFEALKNALYAAAEDEYPSAVRYSNSCENEDINAAFYTPDKKSDKLGVRTNYESTENIENIIITYGMIAKNALSACRKLREDGESAGVILLEYLKPYDKIANEIEKEIPQTCKKIVFVEEGILAGGAGMLIYEKIRNRAFMQNIKYEIMAIDDNFAIRDKDEDVYASVGLSDEDIIKKIQKVVAIF